MGKNSKKNISRAEEKEQQAHISYRFTRTHG